jgi:hypothetical protein
MNKGQEFTPEQQEFINEALKKSMESGKDAALLLVGSRAANLSDSWSDLDLWILGNKKNLSIEEQQKYEIDKQLFFDKGDYESHWSFFDFDDIEIALRDWNDEIMWILDMSQIIFSNSARIVPIKNYCKQYPDEIAEMKLKRQFGKYCSLLGPLNMAARNKPLSAFVVTGLVIECLCKICCLAERMPFPYSKWLTEVAKETQLGSMIFPNIDRAIKGIEEFTNPHAGKHYRELIPLKELRDTLEIVKFGLHEMGWKSSWIDNKEEALSSICGCRTIG